MLLKQYRQEQSCVIRSAFNRYQDKLDEKSIRANIKDLDNITLDSWWKASAIVTASGIYQKLGDKKVIFGGKQNLYRYNRGLITKDEFKARRLRPLVSIGEAFQTGNRKFRLDVENNTLIFQDKKGKVKHKLIFNPQYRSYLRQLKFIEEQTKLKKQPLTVMVDEMYIHLTFQPEQQVKQETIANRVLDIDSNPNNIGWSVSDVNGDTDEVNVVTSGVIDLKKLNTRSTNKRHHETYQVVKYLMNLARHYKCDRVCFEELNVKKKDHGKGKRFNKLVNNTWIRAKLFTSLKKWCDIYQIKCIEVNPAYSSIIGGVIHRTYPDPIAPTLELARRAVTKFCVGKFYPKVPCIDDLNELWKQTLDRNIVSWKDVATQIKDTKFNYRVSCNGFKLHVLRLKSRRSCVNHSFV